MYKKSKTKLISVIVVMTLLVATITVCIANINSEKSFTLMIYMCGNDLETNGGYATKSIEQMLSADLPDNTKIIIQTGGTKKWRKYNIPSNKNCIYEIKNKELVLKKQSAAESMGKTETLVDFINWGENNYPSDKFGLVLWNHGGGALGGVCYDENCNNDSLSLTDISTALSKQTNKFEFIGFDACLMANYETAVTVAPFSNYMIASEELESTNGWDYNILLTNLNNCKNFVNEFARKQSDNNYFTISCVDLNRIDEIEDIVTRIMEKSKGSSLGNFCLAAEASLQFGSRSDGNTQSGFIDLGCIAKNMLIENNLSEIVVCKNGKLRNTATGLSIYVPINGIQNLKKYCNLAADEKYSTFLDLSFSNSENKEINLLNCGTNVDNKLQFEITDESNSIFMGARYALFYYDDKGKLGKDNGVYFLGEDNDIISDGNKYTINFDGNWVYFNDNLLYCSIDEETNDSIIYSSTVKINGNNCNMMFLYDKKDYETTILGYSKINDFSGRIEQLKGNEEITVIYGKLDNNTLIQNEIDTEQVASKTFIYSSDMKIEVKKLDNGKYMYIGLPCDIYGKITNTNLALFDMKDGQITNFSVIS